MAQRNDIIVRVGVGEVFAMVVAEGSSWNPDVAKDIINRTDELWQNTIEAAVDAGLIDIGTPTPIDDDEDDDEFFSDLDDLFSDKEVD
jgi:hypothetical protein